VAVSVRSLLVPSVALAATSSIALGSMMAAPPAVTLARPAVQVPAVHIEDIQLAGIGQDIYYAIQPWVQYGVELAQWATVWIPPVSSQIGILYFDGIQPVVEATVNALAGVVQNPFNIIGVLSAYGATLGVIGYNFVAAEAAWLGFPLPPLPPLPPLASVSRSSTPTATARSARGSLAAAVATVVSAESASDIAVEAPAPARASRGELRRAARAAVADAEPQTGTAVSDAAPLTDTAVSDAAPLTGTAVSAAAHSAASEVRSTARAARGAAAKAVKAAIG
jgi:hypothetical protein